jgi:hypothetical protein
LDNEFADLLEFTGFLETPRVDLLFSGRHEAVGVWEVETFVRHAGGVLSVWERGGRARPVSADFIKSVVGTRYPERWGRRPFFFGGGDDYGYWCQGRVFKYGGGIVSSF